MNALVYSLQDFFELTFQYMPTIGSAVNLFFMATIASLMVYWIIQMYKNPDSV